MSSITAVKPYRVRDSLEVVLLLAVQPNPSLLEYWLKSHKYANGFSMTMVQDLTQVSKEAPAIKSTSDRLIDPFVHPVSEAGFELFRMLPELADLPPIEVFERYLRAAYYLAAITQTPIHRFESEIARIYYRNISQEESSVFVNASYCDEHDLGRISMISARRTEENIKHRLSNLSGRVLIYCDKFFQPAVRGAIDSVVEGTAAQPDV